MKTFEKTFILFVLLASLSLSGCGVGQLLGPAQTATPSQTPTLPDTATPVATATVTNTPSLVPTATFTVTSTPAPSKLTGHLIWKTSGAAIVGADIFLCLATADTCQLDPTLKATTQSEGVFEFASLLPGNYVILYAENGGANPSAGSLNLSKDSLSCLGEGFVGAVSTKCQGIPQLFGEGTLTLKKGSQLIVSTTGMTLSDGSISSATYNLSLDFADGKPISVEIIGGKDQDMTIKAWDE